MNEPRYSFGKDVLWMIRKNPSLAIGMILLAIIIIIALIAPWISFADPTAVAPIKRNLPPSHSAWFGTDALGRDIYARTIYGTRVSVAIGFSVAAVTSILGLAIGLVSGFIRALDGIIMRITDGLMAIPSILLAVALMALTGGSLWTVIGAITVAETPRMARLVRGVVLSIRDQPFVEAAITTGTRTPVIMLRHILPNTVPTLSVQATYVCANAMITESFLSFIGAGVPPITPSWGNIIAEGRALWQIYPHMIAFPAIFLSVTVLSVNMLGDGIRDAMAPRKISGS
ncbi:ABC transporter permease (plasmid) [Mesorhizobium sp. ORM8.1]